MIRKNSYKKWWIIALLLVFVCLYKWYEKQPIKSVKLDVDTILARSELKDRTFNSVVQEIKSNTLKGFLLEEHSNPIVSISFSFERAGVAYEPDDKAGIAQLTAAMLTEGAGEYDALQFKQVSEQYGIKIGFSASLDDFSGYLIYPCQYQNIAIRLIRAALLHPAWDEGYLRLNKEKMLLALQKQQEQPNSYLNYKFNDKIFAGHPYSRNLLGDAKVIPLLTVADLRNYHRTYLTQDNLIVGVAGDIPLLIRPTKILILS